MIQLDKLYFGVVEDLADPEERGRIRVRIIGLHTDDKTAIPTSSLPWSTLMSGSSNPNVSGVGMTPVGLVEGTEVSLIPVEPDNLQEFIVLGTNSGNRQVFNNISKGFNDPYGTLPTNNNGSDINVLARGQLISTSPIYNQSENGFTSSTTDNYQASTVTISAADAAKATWMTYAISQIGVTETNNPAQIQKYLATVGFSNTNYIVAWCSAFCSACMVQAKIPHKGVTALARSWLNFGTVISLANAPVGSVVVLRPNSSPGASSGHVAFLAKKWDGLSSKIYVIGGNQKFDTQTKTKSGVAGVTESEFPTNQIVSIRWPSIGS